MASNNDLSLIRLSAVGFLLVSLGTFGYYSIDGLIDDSEGGSHLVNSFYCSVITLTTVGYGDICPGDKMDDLGRLFVVGLSFGGLGMFCGPIMDAASSWSSRIPGGANLSCCLCTLLWDASVRTHRRNGYPESVVLRIRHRNNDGIWRSKSKD